ncbi:MAG TPA: hypothetical protein VLE93_01140 [Candidatus Saccharimonadales bacterium]|nr:hypothetical protein [Candidatus Saccharimonadales bacterium]
MDLRKVSDGVHFQGIVETEGALSVINVEGVYDPKTSAGTLRYEA